MEVRVEATVNQDKGRTKTQRLIRDLFTVFKEKNSVMEYHILFNIQQILLVFTFYLSFPHLMWFKLILFSSDLYFRNLPLNWTWKWHKIYILNGFILCGSYETVISEISCYSVGCRLERKPADSRTLEPQCHMIENCRSYACFVILFLLWEGWGFFLIYILYIYKACSIVLVC